MERIVIGVCTHKRPKMLAQCLAALDCQIRPEGCSVEVVIVDNESEPANQGIVEGFKRYATLPVHYVHQPRRGIACARNAILDNALDMGADWIAMIDDDEMADPDWIVRLMTFEYRDTDVLMGLNVPLLPQPLPFWVTEERFKFKEGEACRTAYCGNVRFSAEIARSGLRFNENIGLGIDEDGDFFARAKAQGSTIKRTLRAITREHAHPQRFGYRAQLYRAHCSANSRMCRMIEQEGRTWTLLRKGHTIPTSLLFGAAFLLASGPA